MTNSAGKTRWAVLIALLIAGVYGLNLDTRWRMGRDSALYLGMGESFASGHGPTFNGDWLPGFNPGLPLVWAGILRTIGPNYLAGRAMMVGFAMLLIAAGFLLVRDRRPLPVPLLVLALLACNAQLFDTAGMLLTDLPFTALLTLTVLGLYRALAGRLVLALAAGAVFGLAFLMRLEALVVLPLLAVGVLLDGSATKSFRRRLLAVGLFLVSLAPILAGWYVWYHSMSQSGSHGYFETAAGKSSIQVLRTIAGNLPELPVYLMGLLVGQRPAWYLAAPLCCVLIPGVVISWRRREILLLVLAGGYMLFHLAWDVTSVNARYLMPMLPVAALWLADGVRAVFAWMARVRPGLAGRIPARFSTAAVVAAMAALSLIPKLADTACWKFRPTVVEVRSQREARLCDVAMWIRGHSSARDVLIARERPILHYLAGPIVLLVPIMPPGASSEESSRALEPVIGRATLVVVGPGDDVDEQLLGDWVKAHDRQWEFLVPQGDYRVYRRRS